MVVQLLPAVVPALPFPSLDDVMETREMLLSAASESLACQCHTHTGEREPKPSFVLCSHVILRSQRSFFVSIREMDSG